MLFDEFITHITALMVNATFDTQIHLTRAGGRGPQYRSHGYILQFVAPPRYYFSHTNLLQSAYGGKGERRET